MIFYTADLHLGYFPILHDTARPFSGVPEMDEALIANWNARVGADDSVYIVGDFSYNGGEAPTQYLARLNGHLHLIRGNRRCSRCRRAPTAAHPASCRASRTSARSRRGIDMRERHADPQISVHHRRPCNAPRFVIARRP